MSALASLALGCHPPAPASSSREPDAAAAGFSWQMIRRPSPSELFLAVWASAAGDVYAASEGENYVFSVVSSHDHGVTWQVSSVGDSVAPLTGVVGIGSANVYAVGSTRPSYAENALPFVAVSTDGGTTFTPTYPPFGGGINAVAADPGGNLVAVGAGADGGFVARSTDGAATWTRAAVPGTSGLDGIWVAADGTIYACGLGMAARAPGDGDGDGAASAVGDEEGEAGAAMDGGTPASAGVVIRSTNGGATWRPVATALGGLFAISGTPDQTRMMAVGAGYTNIELEAGATSWYMHAGDPQDVAENDGDFTGVWISDTRTSPYMTAGNAGYVVRGADDGGSEMGDVVTSSEDLPAAGPGLQSGAFAVTGTGPDDVWAVGSGIFHRTMH